MLGCLLLLFVLCVAWFFCSVAELLGGASVVPEKQQQQWQ